MILTDREIQIALSKGQISIKPEPEVEAYSSTTVDLRLDEHLTEFNDGLENSSIEKVIDPSFKGFNAEKTLAEITHPTNITEAGYLLVPKKLVLGWTVETIIIPNESRLAARVEGKSSLARLGLGIHVTAPTIHSGFNLPVRLEIINHGALPIRLRKNMRICQLVFELTLGTPAKGFQPLQSAPLPTG